MTSTGVSDIFEILSVHVRLRWSRYAVSTSSVDIRTRGCTTHRIDEIIGAFLSIRKYLDYTHRLRSTGPRLESRVRCYLSIAISNTDS